MDKEIVISIKTILLTVLIIIGLYLVYIMAPVILTFFISTLIVIAMEHPIQAIAKIKWMNKPLGRNVATIVAYFIAVIGVVLAVTIIVPPVVVQAQKLIINISNFIREVPGGQEFDYKSILGDISSISQNFFSTTTTVFSALATVFSILIISIYMSIDWMNIKRRVYALFQGDIRKEVEKVTDEIEVSLGHWIKGQLYLMLIVGVMSFIGLAILRVENALALGLISGLLEIVPLLGPLLAAAIAGIVGFSESTAKGILVIALFTLIQQLENNLLVPKVMQKVSGFSPLAILLALLVGTRLLGSIGAVIAVPVMMILVVIIKHVTRYQKENS